MELRGLCYAYPRRPGVSGLDGRPTAPRRRGAVGGLVVWVGIAVALPVRVLLLFSLVLPYWQRPSQYLWSTPGCMPSFIWGTISYASMRPKHIDARLHCHTGVPRVPGEAGEAGSVMNGAFWTRCCDVHCRRAMVLPAPQLRLLIRKSA